MGPCQPEAEQGERKDGIGAAPDAAAACLDAAHIFRLVKQGSCEAALRLLDDCPGIWAGRDQAGHSLLHWSTLRGSIDLVHAAIDGGVPVDGPSQNGQTPLMWAAIRDHLPGARALLDAKASPRLQDSKGATPLMIAVQHLSHRTELLLLHHGQHSLLDDRDANGCTAAHWAAYKGDLLSLKLLDHFGADLLARDSRGMLPVHRAVSAHQLGVVEFLVGKRSDLMLRDSEGRTCLDIANRYANELWALKHLLTRSEERQQHDHGTVFRAALCMQHIAPFVLPATWACCASFAAVEYLTDLRALGWSSAPTTSLLNETGMLLTVCLFMATMLLDPGTLPARPGPAVLQELAGAVASGADDRLPDMRRLCPRTWVLKGPGTEYCAQLGACVQGFDHYCPWLKNAIGAKNYLPFISLAAVHLGTQAAHLCLLWLLSHELVPYDPERGVMPWVWGWLWHRRLPLLAASLHLLTAPMAIGALLAQLLQLGMRCFLLASRSGRPGSPGTGCLGGWLGGLAGVCGPCMPASLAPIRADLDRKCQ